MHPDLVLYLINQRAREARAATKAAQLAKDARKLRRSQRKRTGVADAFAVPAIPDYIDMLFDETDHGSTHHVS